MSNYSDSNFQKDPNTSWFKVFNAITNASTVLDIGCSSGNFGKELIDQRGCTVDGVEIDPGDRTKAKTRLRRVYDFNIESGSPDELKSHYDYVYYGDVIEHLINPRRALENTKPLLKKNGAVIFSIPNMAHMSVRLMLLKGEFEYGETGLLDKTHLHFYTLEEVKRLFFEAGFDLIKLDYVERDIPREVLEAELNAIGLTPSSDFLDKSKNVDASAYQFVGIAKPSKNPKPVKPRKTLSPPINEMEKHMEYMHTVHDARLVAHKEAISTLEKENEKLKKKLKELTKRSLIRRLLG